VRRAAILHSLLEKREPRLRFGEQIMIDDDILSALLTVPRYQCLLHVRPEGVSGEDSKGNPAPVRVALFKVLSNTCIPL
jgi:hypothetical protein